MGVSVGMYNKIELGERTVKNDLIPILAKTLNTDTCTINSLYLADTFYREATQYSKEVVGRALDILCDNLNHLKK